MNTLTKRVLTTCVLALSITNINVGLATSAKSKPTTIPRYEEPTMCIKGTSISLKHKDSKKVQTQEFVAYNSHGPFIKKDYLVSVASLYELDTKFAETIQEELVLQQLYEYYQSKKNLKMMLLCIQHARGLDQAWAYDALGYLYINSLTGKEKKDTDDGFAISCFKTAEAMKYAHALTSLGICYEGGIGVKKNPKMASYYYHKAALVKDSEGLYRYGLYLVEKDPMQAWSLIHASANLGFAPAKAAIRLQDEQRIKAVNSMCISVCNTQTNLPTKVVKVEQRHDTHYRQPLDDKKGRIKDPDWLMPFSDAHKNSSEKRLIMLQERLIELSKKE